MSKSSSVVASSPFLTVTQAAGELGIEPLGVRRLIALGVLKASRLGEAGEWKLLPEDLAAYVGKGAPRLQMPPLEFSGDWFRYNPMHLAAASFEEQAAKQLELFLPETCPEEAYASPSSFDLRPADAAGLIQKLAAKSPIEQGVRLTNDRSLFKTRGAEWQGQILRQELQSLAQPSITEQVNDHVSPLLKLYDSPEGFWSMVKEAWKAVRQRQFLASRFYPAREYGQQPPRVTVLVRAGDALPDDLEEVMKAV